MLIVGSDGLWDLFAYEEAIDEVRACASREPRERTPAHARACATARAARHRALAPSPRRAHRTARVHSQVLQSGYDLTTQDGVSAACEQLLATTKTKGEELLGSSTDDTTIMVISFVKN